MKKNRGFTLVELIVVLVILAILAAILVPALLGYIDKAKDAKDVIDAKTLLDASQAELAVLYGKNDGAADFSVIPGYDTRKKNNNRDITATDTAFANSILADTDVEKPYLFMIATGSTLDNSLSAREKYQVYYALYMKTEKSAPLYYYNGAWHEENPSVIGVFDKQNNYKIGNKKVRLQYYLLIYGGNRNMYDDFGDTDKNLWSWLKETVANGENRN